MSEDAGRQSSKSQRSQQNSDDQRGASRKSGQSQKSVRLGSRNADESLIIQDNQDATPASRRSGRDSQQQQQQDAPVSRRSVRDEQQDAPVSRKSGLNSQQQEEAAPGSRRSGVRDEQQDAPVSRKSGRNSQQQEEAAPGSRRSAAPSQNLNTSQRSVRDGAETQNGWPTIQDFPSRLSTHDRELINKSRNDYYGQPYINDVKTYFEHPSFDGIEAENNKKYLEDLLSDFRKLLKITLDDENDRLHDVIFVQSPDSTEALPAHEQLLTARSATFEALFRKIREGETSFLGFELLSNSNERVRRILLPSEGFINFELVEASLHYMYWGNIDERLVGQEESLKQFFEIASFLDLKELRRHLADKLFERLKERPSARQSVEYLKLAVKCGCKYLKRETIDFIVANKANIVDDDDWKSFIEERKSIELVKEIYQRMVELSSQS